MGSALAKSFSRTCEATFSQATTYVNFSFIFHTVITESPQGESALLSKMYRRISRQKTEKVKNFVCRKKTV